MFATFTMTILQLFWLKKKIQGLFVRFFWVVYSMNRDWRVISFSQKLADILLRDLIFLAIVVGFYSEAGSAGWPCWQNIVVGFFSEAGSAGWPCLLNIVVGFYSEAGSADWPCWLNIVVGVKSEFGSAGWPCWLNIVVGVYSEVGSAGWPCWLKWANYKLNGWFILWELSFLWLVRFGLTVRLGWLIDPVYVYLEFGMADHHQGWDGLAIVTVI